MNLAVLAPQWLALLLILALLLAAAEDFWRLRISNWTVLAVLGLAIVAMVVIGPTWHLWENGVILVAALVIGTPLFAAGKLGGGDVKLLAASAFWFEFSSVLRMIVAVAIAGGLLALTLMALRRVSWGETTLARLPVLRRRGGIPYGVAIAAGTILTIVVAREAARII